MINKEFVTYELSLKLKELGFDTSCIAYYDENGVLYPMACVYGPDTMHFGSFIPKYQYPANDKLIAAPLWQQAFDFFREKYDLDCIISYGGRPKEYSVFTKSYLYGNNRNNPNLYFYEDAKIAGLEDLIKKVYARTNN